VEKAHGPGGLAAIEERIAGYTEKVRTFEQSRDRLVQEKPPPEARFGSATQRTAEYATQRDRVQRALSEALKQGSFASIEDLSAALLGKEEEEALEKELNDWKESLSALQSLHAEQGRVLKELENRKVVQRTSWVCPRPPCQKKTKTWTIRRYYSGL